MTAPLVRAENVSRSFVGRSGWLARRAEVKAVREVDLTIGRGEALGVVGESGCGKSTLGRMLLHLLPPTSGSVLFDGRALHDLTPATRRRMRARMQMIFQDPYASLDPRRRTGEQIADGIMIPALADRTEARARVADLLQRVGLDPVHGDRLPHEFSGRPASACCHCARARTKPDFIVADEPVSALDVSVQAQIVTLLCRFAFQFRPRASLYQPRSACGAHLCERVVVMYLGRVVEEGNVSEIFRAPAPSLHPRADRRDAVDPRAGRVLARRCCRENCRTRPHRPPAACSAPAARMRLPPCAESIPVLRQIAPGRRVACLRDDVVAQHG